jgi:hypothetical protein
MSMAVGIFACPHSPHMRARRRKLFDLRRVERHTGSTAGQPDLASYMVVQILRAANRVAPAPLIPERVRSRSAGAAQATN